MSPQRQLQKGKCYKSLQQRSALFSAKEKTHLEQIHRRPLRLNNQDVQELGALFHIVQSCWWERCVCDQTQCMTKVWPVGGSTTQQAYTSHTHTERRTIQTSGHIEMMLLSEGLHLKDSPSWLHTVELYFLSVITLRLDHFDWLFGAGIKLNQNHSTACNLCQSAELLCFCYCHQIFQLPGCRQEKYAIPLWLWFTTLSALNLSWPL